MASPDGRNQRSRTAPPEERLRFAGLLAISLVLNLAVLYGLFHEAFFDAAETAAPVEIAVEVVPEPEPPAAPQRQEAPKPPPEQQRLDEKPATDAPRAANEEKIERDAPNDVTKGPQVAPQAEQTAAQPEPKPDVRAAPEKPTQPSPTAAAPEPSENRAEADEIRNATPAEATAEPEAQAKSKADAKHGMSEKEMVAAFGPAPEYEFGSAARETPVAGGHAKSSYLTILYGMVMPKMRIPLGVGSRRGNGIVNFAVDSWGGLSRIGLLRSSGSPDLDAAAMNAIRAAAPFPPPPGHHPISMNFTYSPR